MKLPFFMPVNLHLGPRCFVIKPEDFYVMIILPVLLHGFKKDPVFFG